MKHNSKTISECQYKAKIAFCLATCHNPMLRDTCTSLGACKDYDEFCNQLNIQLKDLRP